MLTPEPFTAPGVQGFLHRPQDGKPPEAALVITHGAGGNANVPMLIAIANALSARGILVLRCNLPYRQARPSGPPRPADAAKDREGLRLALESVRPLLGNGKRVYLGGHSYGGRQASMLAADQPGIADGLLLCSYPLHPPGQPGKLRTEHLPRLTLPVLFVHGARDTFGSPEEMRTAVKLIPGPVHIEFIEGAGHDLNRGRNLEFLDQFPPRPVAGS